MTGPQVENQQPEIEMPPLPPEPAPEQEAPDIAEQQPEEAQAKPTAEDNMRNLRKAKEAAERERDEMRQYLESLRREQLEREKNVQKVNEQEDSDLRPDDIPEWRHVDKHIKKLEQQLQAYQQQASASATEAKLKTQYPDFDQVVSESNIRSLREKYPELATTINSTQDLYSKAVSAYTIIKRMGIASDQTYNKDHERAVANVNKPRPLSSVAPQQGESPLSRANAFAEGLTDELKEQLRKEMREAVKYR